MYYQNSGVQLNEKEATQLARAVQLLLRELGFSPDEVERSYRESRAYFLKNDHIDQEARKEEGLIEQIYAITS